MISATREIHNYTGRNFNRDTSSTPVAETRVFPGKYTSFVDVSDFYTDDDLVIETGSVGSWAETWAPTDYQLEPLNGIRDGNPGWPYFRIRAIGTKSLPIAGRQAVIRVTAFFGWESVPEDVKTACYILCAESFKMAEAPFGVAGWSEMGVVRVREIPKVEKLLYPYQVQRVKIRAG